MIDEYYVIDAHVHVYPENIVTKAALATDVFYEQHSAHIGSYDDLITTMKNDFVDHCVICYCATAPKYVKRTNETIAGYVKKSGGRLTGLGTMHPDSNDKMRDALYIKELGLTGIKIHPDIQDFHADCDGSMEIMEAAYKLDMPVLIHTGDIRYDNSNPNRIINILNEFPDLTVIGAHFGGYTVWDDAVRVLSGKENFFVDWSSASFMLSPQKLRWLIDSYGVERVMFGSDYPMWDAKTEADRLLGLGYSEREYRKMFSENAVNIYGITLPDRDK